MIIKTAISLIFIFLMVLIAPAKASVCSPNTPLFMAKSQTISPHLPQKKEIDKMAILGIFLCIMAGTMGIHRVVMGGSPWLIVAYSFTFGGFFGLLPLMDFVRLLSEPVHYKNNHKFFAAFGAM